MKNPIAERTFMHGAETDALVSKLIGSDDQWSFQIGAAWVLFREMEQYGAVAVKSSLLDDRYECSIVFSQSQQSMTSIVNGFSDTAPGAICAAFIRLHDALAVRKVEKRRKAALAKKPRHTSWILDGNGNRVGEILDDDAARVRLGNDSYELEEVAHES